MNDQVRDARPNDAKNAESLCDTHDMILIHRVFRREFALLPMMVARTRDGDTAQAAVIATHAREMVTMLSHHHHGEDDLLWPKLLQRVRLQHELIERMEAQHEKVAALLEPLASALDAWEWSADCSSRERLSDVLRPLPGALNEHLADEERHILPIVEKTITAAEWGELGERGIVAMPRPRMLVFLGRILEEANAVERQAFLKHVPVPARIAFRVVGRRRYLAETARARRDLVG